MLRGSPWHASAAQIDRRPNYRAPPHAAVRLRLDFKAAA
jgi:hypothetical protein